METTITLSNADGSAFKGVARLVAKGEPPDWLLRGLEHFSAGIGADREDQYRDVRREICAAVIIEAWKLLHGEAEPRSESFEQACADYWQACGGEEIGETNDPSNWRWSIERALKKAEGYQWVNKVLTMARNAPE